MTTNLMELIEMLQDIVEQVGEDAASDVEVRLAHQPNYPFEYSLSGVQLVSNPDVDEDDCPDCDGDGCEKCQGSGRVYEMPDDAMNSEHIVYLVEGNQMGYLPGKATREIGWRE